MWRNLLSQQVFFTEEKAIMVKPIFSKARIPLFTRGTTFKCSPSQRTLNELENDSTQQRLQPPLSFQRLTLIKQPPRSIDEPWNTTPKQWSTTYLNGIEISNNSSIPQLENSSTNNFLDATPTTTNGGVNMIKRLDNNDNSSGKNFFLFLKIIREPAHRKRKKCVLNLNTESKTIKARQMANFNLGLKKE